MNLIGIYKNKNYCLEIKHRPLSETMLDNRIELTQEAIVLADTYIKEKVVGKTSITDCRHIALATINKVDVLVSWNFKHIVNLDKIKGYNSVNLRLGYMMVEIRSPKDLINYAND